MYAMESVEKCHQPTTEELGELVRAACNDFISGRVQFFSENA